jgi:tetratricopeptide (TPR) repeat protein
VTNVTKSSPLLVSTECNETKSFSSGQYDNAIRAYTEAIRLDPNYVRDYNNRGNAYLHQG